MIIAKVKVAKDGKPATDQKKYIAKELGEMVNTSPDSIASLDLGYQTEWYDLDYIEELFKQINDIDRLEVFMQLIKEKWQIHVYEHHYCVVDYDGESRTYTPCEVNFLEKIDKLFASVIGYKKHKEEAERLSKKLLQPTKPTDLKNEEPKTITAENSANEPALHLAKEVDRLTKKVENLTKEVERLAKENENLKNQQDKEQSWNNVEDLSDIERLEIDERIIFFVSALGIDLDGNRISQKRLAMLIAKLSPEKPGERTDKEEIEKKKAESIRTRIVKLNTEEKSVRETKLDCFSDDTRKAALNVYDYISKVPKDKTALTQKTKDIMENISLVYQLNKNIP